LAAAVIVGLAISLMGALLPREHKVSRATDFKCPPSVLYAVVRDFATYPVWNSNAQTVEILPPTNGRTAFRVTTRHGAVTYVVVDDHPAEKLVLKIADENLPYGGSWNYAFTSDRSGTRLEITEQGFIKKPVFRFFARFVFGYTRSIETCFRDLKRKLGETPD
jgi:hypothetical protein